jgi:hypothetical protein
MATRDVDAAGSIAYVVGRSNGPYPYVLAALDVTDPASPVEVGRLRVFLSEDVEVMGGRAYVPEWTPHNVRVADLTRLAPRWLGGFEALDTIFDVEVDAGLVHVVSIGSSTPPATTYQVFDLGPEYRTPREVAIDIRPGTSKNVIVPGGLGLVPLAILGAEDLDASQVDPTSLDFGPEAATAMNRPHPRLYDIDRDGFEDLLVFFRTRDTGIAAGDTSACLTGSHTDGAPLRGCDAVFTLSVCGHGFEAALFLPLGVAAVSRLRRTGSHARGAA